MGYDPSNEVAARYYAIGINDDSDIDDDAYASAQTSGLSTVDCPDVNGADGPVVSGNAADLVDNDPNNDNDRNSTGTDSMFGAGKRVGAEQALDEPAPAFSDLGDQSDEDNQTFIIAAEGIISADKVTAGSGAGANTSVFVINQAKRLTNTRAGY